MNTFLDSLTKDDYWKLVEVIGVWFGGAGAFFAALVALWIANQKNRVKLKIRVAAAQEFQPGIGSIAENVWISITNISYRLVVLASIYWKLSPLTRSELWQNTNEPRIFKIPEKVDAGEKADFYIAIGGDHDAWYRYFWRKAFRGSSPARRWIDRKCLMLAVATTTGKNFQVKPERSFLKKLDAALEEILTEKAT